MKFIKIAKYWLPLIFYMTLIFYLSSQSHPPVPMSGVWNIDKVYHLIEYSVFSFLAFLAFTHTPSNLLSKNAIILAIIFTSFYGATDEIHQFFVQGRFASVIDWFFDSVGGFVGIFFARLGSKVYAKGKGAKGLRGKHMSF